MVSWVVGMHRRFADSGAMGLVTATNVPKCWVSPPVPPGLTLVGLRCSLSLIPHKTGAFPMSFFHQDQGAPACLAVGCSTHQPTANGVLSPTCFPYGSSDDLQHLDWFFKRNFGNFHGGVVAGVTLPRRGLASDAHPAPLWSVN